LITLPIVFFPIPLNFFLFQDDPSAPHKIQEVLKSCLKEEESFNIQNSMSPKLEGGKGDQADLEVNCVQNNLT
jgi:chondroitin sulfate proteoglycan 5